jgi:predicted amidophosphoribosyltransferase
VSAASPRMNAQKEHGAPAGAPEWTRADGWVPTPVSESQLSQRRWYQAYSIARRGGRAVPVDSPKLQVRENVPM